MDYKIAVRNYILKKQFIEKNKEDFTLDQLSKDLDFALSKVKTNREAGTFKNVLVGLAMSVALLNVGSVKADDFNPEKMEKQLDALDGMSNGLVKTDGTFSENEGHYLIKIGPYSLIGKYNTSKGEGDLVKVNHDLKIRLAPNTNTEEVKKYKPIIEKFQKLMAAEGYYPNK